MTLASDVVVVGAGLAGATLALRLARGGATVTLVDRHSFPRDKPCGEGLLPNGVDALGRLGCADVLDQIDAPAFRGIRYRCGDAEAVGDFDLGHPGRGVHRRWLDAALVARALACPGVALRRGTVVGVDSAREGASVRLADGERLAARIVVGADGPRSFVRRSLGLDAGPPSRKRWALVRHFELPPDVERPDRVAVHVCGGYELYVTPVGTRMVGLAALVEEAVMARGGGTAADRLTALAAGARDTRALVRGGRPAGPTLACGPLRVRARGVHAGNVLLVGDAAGYVDAITGEGMSIALRSSELAADAIRTGLARPADLPAAFARYARARRRHVRDHALLTLGLVWVARHPGVAHRLVRGLAAHPRVFARLLAVNDGRRPLVSLPPLDLLRLATGGAALRVRPE